MLVGRVLVEAAGYALKAVLGLLPQPLHDASHVIAVGDVVAERRETMWLAALFEHRPAIIARVRLIRTRSEAIQYLNEVRAKVAPVTGKVRS
jgi:hypothetical protein